MNATRKLQCSTRRFQQIKCQMRRATQSTGRHLAGLLIVVSSLGLHIAFANQPGIQRTDLQRNDLSTQGQEVVQVRVEFEAGATAAAHKHPGEEIVYVIEGSLEYQVEGRPAVILEAGDVLFIPSGAVHAVRNMSNEKSAELATYIVEKGKPLVVPST